MIHTNHSPVGASATWGMFWGLLFGLLFFIPFFGMAIRSRNMPGPLRAFALLRIEANRLVRVS